MYLFARSTRLQDADGMGWAVGVAERARKISGLEVELWMHVWSPEFGRVVWTAFVPDLTTLAAAGDKLAADPGFAAEEAKGAALTIGGLDDAVSTVVHGDLDPDAPQAEYVAGVSAVCANGALTKGMTAGVEIAQLAEKVTGLPTMFVANMTGSYGGVGWFTGYENVAALETAQQALAGDADWAKQVDKAGAVYADAPSLTTQLVYRRLL